VSIDYLTRLEQGRDSNPSASVLAALASALRLSDGERTHLAKLAALGQSREMCPEATPLADGISPGVRLLLDDLDSTPAFVVGGIGDVVAWNAPWERLVAPLGMLDDARVNLARYVFTHADARTVYIDWDAAADEQVARLRAAEPRWREEPAYVALLEELLAIDAFASRWSTHPVAEKRRGEKQLRHPEVGDLARRRRCQRRATRRAAERRPTRESRPALGGRQPLARVYGVRPMNARSLVWPSASSGTATRGPY
jgi:transcriptional regulator with XRE-family HTH domain